MTLQSYEFKSTQVDALVEPLSRKSALIDSKRSANAVCCSVLLCVAVCCRVLLQSVVAVCCFSIMMMQCLVRVCIAASSSMLQFVAVFGTA